MEELRPACATPPPSPVCSRDTPGKRTAPPLSSTCADSRNRAAHDTSCTLPVSLARSRIETVRSYPRGSLCTRLVGRSRPDGARENASVWIVAVHAAHRAFGQLVFVWPLETRPFRRVAAGALRVDSRPAPWYQFFIRLMHRMAGYAAHLIARVSALDSSHVRRLVQMATQTAVVRLGCRQLRRIANSAAEVLSACLLPGPWHDSHARVSNPRRLSSSTAWCGFFLKAL